MYAQSFRDIAAYGDNFTTQKNNSFRSFWSVVTDKTYGGPNELQDAILKWKNDVVNQFLQWRYPMTQVQRLNMHLYRGRHYFSQDMLTHLPYNRNKVFSKDHAKIVLNYIKQAVDQHVADQCAFEPNLTVMPNNDEEGDRVAARSNKQCLDYYFYTNKVKLLFQTYHRRKKIHGETFMFCLWDADAGDFHPKYKEYMRIRREMGMGEEEPIPLTDPETGEPIIGTDGKPLFIQHAVRTGDVSIQLEHSERVLYPCPESFLWNDVPYCIRMVWTDIDEVKARWPQAADKISSDGLYRRYVSPLARSLQHKVCVRYLYHKPTRFLPQGYYVVSTEKVILEMEPRSIANHDYLPCVRATDVDLDDEITGMSFIQNLVTLQAAINNSTSMILQNQSLFAYPKYTVPRGAKVKFVNLADDRGIYEYSGAQPPQLIAANSTPADVWKWRDVMRDEFKNLSAIFMTSEGRAPDGITANVALRMIDEQERKFHKPAIDKHGDNVELLGTLILATLGTYRQPDDGALIEILGKNNERYMRYFDVENLSRPWVVKLMKSSGLPESPAAKTQTVLDLADRFQGLWSHDEILEYLDIARPEKLIESATVARQAAESEVEDILSGLQTVPPPSQYHDMLPRYSVYEKAVQSRDFDESDPTIKQRMIAHIVTSEYLISKKMQLNPMFAQKVLTEHPNFPMFFPMNPSPSMPFSLAQGTPPAPPMPPGAAPLAGLPPDVAAGAPMPPEAPPAPTAGPAPVKDIPPGPPPTEAPQAPLP